MLYFSVVCFSVLCELTQLYVFQRLKMTTQTCLVLCVFWWAMERKDPFLDQISDGSPSKLWPLPWPQTSAQLCRTSRKSSSFRFLFVSFYFLIYPVRLFILLFLSWFHIKACRGEMYDPGVETDSEEAPEFIGISDVPELDFLCCYSTVEGLHCICSVVI